MAPQSSAPPNPTEEKPQDQNPEAVQPMNGIQQEIPKQSPPSVFVNLEPMREDQVQNAVKFLSHPKVRGSPVIYRRSFLEKKGLTKEEIDEAFRRVPDSTPSAQATNVNQEGQVKSTPSIQPQAPTQILQPTAATQTGVISTAGTLRRFQFRWYHAVVAVGLLAISGAGTAVLVKNTIVPRLKSWIRKVVLEEEEDNSVKKPDVKPSLAEEAAAAAKSAAAAAADVAKASQEMLNSKNQEKRYFEDFMSLLDAQVQEMKTMSASIRKLEGQTNNFGRTSIVSEGDHKVLVANPKQMYTNGTTEIDSRSVRSSSPPLSAEPSMAPHPKSYMEIMEMVQRGEKPPNIRDINDQPPNPNQQISNPRLAPRIKPWEVGQVQNGSNQMPGEGLNSKVQDNGVMYQFNGESSAPWWQRQNTRITEIVNEDDELKGRRYAGGITNEQPVQRKWVPPQPPPVVMPEAAEAIRRPKPSIQKEQLGDDQSASHSTDATDELQRPTNVYESGSAVEINGAVNGMNSSEISEVQEHSYEGN